jgi:uncharacterized membrane protein YphA (DoxX/SURF4 family)
MSVDTRTPRTHTGGRTSASVDEPVLSMVKIPSDPAQVTVNHASFRVRLGATSANALDRAARVPLIPSAVRPARRAPVVWSGHSAPGDQAATQLLRAVMRNEDEDTLGAGGATRLLPRVNEETQPVPTVVEPRRPMPPDELLGGVRQVRRAYRDDAYEDEYGDEYREQYGYGDSDGPARGRPDAQGYGQGHRHGHDQGQGHGYDQGHDHGQGPAGGRPARRRAEPVRHAWYPGRRMNLGIVLLPLRVFLGFITIYAGMSKLCDPVYFDGGKRGSMVTWLTSLHPWTVAEPLRDFAVGHPVGAGLSVAFLQVIAGVLTVLGLWQRVAAAVGALLSVALLVTVSWRTVPVYDTPDFIYLAAWSPLVIAGAPVYSVDGRLAGDAWRRLGPRGASVWDLRRRVLRRGTVLATVVVGLTMVVGSMLGAAVRSAGTRTELPGQSELPINNLQGSPLPRASGGTGAGIGSAPLAGGAVSPSARQGTPSSAASSSAPAERGGRPSAADTAGTATDSGDGAGGYGGTQQPSSPQQQTSRPDSGMVSSSGSGTGAPESSAPSGGAGSPDGGGGSGGALGGLLGSGPPSGWLLGATRAGGAVREGSA